jgi:signal transduction histidine kinase
MSSLARLLILSALLLGLFVAAVLAAQGWLHRQDEKLRGEAIAGRRVQLLKAAELIPAVQPPWNRQQLEMLGDLIEAEITLLPANKEPATAPAGRLAFVELLPGGAGHPPVRAEVVFTTPPLMRLQLVHMRTWSMLLVFTLGIVLLFIAISVLWQRPLEGNPETRTPWRLSRGEMGSLEQLAKVSAAQSSALAEARDVQQRTEQDLLLNQRLLTQSLEEKIRLGRDLHDGLIQSLYATGLTLESIRPLLQSDPAEADRRLGQCLEQFNGTIREVRNHITGLAPAELSRLSFAAAVELFVQELRAGRDLEFKPTIDEDAASSLSPEKTVEILQITREAISNSLRHGGATRISVRLHRNGPEVGLLVQDNGTGFDPDARAGQGHGLGNMQARAAHLGAVLRIDSRPGDGTRVVLTIPVS